ncbi:MAG: diguanylate cyclase, partial [Betaproteobacteria bacterium]|nr:diguanylate cyclase [Betaproteobacteria bacterium]
MTGTYDTWLVILSIVVAVIASYVALALAARVAASAGNKAAHYWLIGGALSMGTGIWSMHFVGMLAFRLPIPMSYDIPITLLSLLIAVLVSGFALYTVSHGTLSVRRLLGAGVLMGAGIASMHYTGMAAMQMEPPISYNALLFVLSILIAIAASLAALWIAFQLRLETALSAFWKKTGSALVMGAAISGMHYTAMAAANFAPNSICTVNPQDINNVWLASTIGGFTVIFLATTLMISVFDARLAERKKAEARLEYLAHHDSLTGLPNRILFRDRLALAMARSKRSQQLLAVILLDLDRFKEINDTLGHTTGDEVLKTVAGLLGESLRDDDTVARLGGDEFTLILETITHVDQVKVVAEKILRAFSDPIVIRRREIFVTASLGITIYPLDVQGIDALLQSADIAMYRAKEEGRNTYEFYAPEMNADA